MTSAKKSLKKVGHVLATTGYRNLGANRVFSVGGKEFHYFYHYYNNTYANERCVEVPIVMSVVTNRPSHSMLEVGNVLNHYVDSPHDVVDKYEREAGVVNCDVTEYQPGRKYDTIVSISTIEHVGCDEEKKDAAKPSRAIDHLRSLLSPGGLMVVTVPTGYNPAVDEGVRTGRFGFQRLIALRRTAVATWCETTIREALQCKYGTPYPCGNGLIIGLIGEP